MPCKPSLALSGLLLGMAGLCFAAPPVLVSQLCAECHRLDGNSTDPKYPKLAGMEQEYLVRQMKAFASNKRRDESMMAIVGSLDTNEFASLAAHFSRQVPVSSSRQTNVSLSEEGRQVFEEGNSDIGLQPCAKCHQSDAGGNARFPRLAGQHSAYVRKQLMDYRSGRRATDSMMTEVAKKLSQAQINALAEYLAGL